MEFDASTTIPEPGTFLMITVGMFGLLRRVSTRKA